MEYKEHYVEWTDDKVSRFWNFQNNYAPFQNNWFTKVVGDGILTFIEKHIDVKGSILDYGAGKGFLSVKLSNKYSVDLYGCDFSEEAIKYNNSILENNKNYKGCLLIREFPSVFSDNQFDIVFLIEAIEHLTDKYLKNTLTEINRILKPGGKLIITTPNNEDLLLAHVCCPDCGGIFHRMQHVRSFNKTSLTKMMNDFGFNLDYCMHLDFNDYLNRTFRKGVIKSLKTLLFKHKNNPHLIWIGSKTK